MKKYLAEMVGTMVLVLMGCGVAVSLGCDPINNIPAVVGTAFAFGLSVVAMAYTIGGISGCHINPAITLGCIIAGRMDAKEGCMLSSSALVHSSVRCYFISSQLMYPVWRVLVQTIFRQMLAYWAACWQRLSSPVYSYLWCWVLLPRPMVRPTTSQVWPSV